MAMPEALQKSLSSFSDLRSSAGQPTSQTCELETDTCPKGVSLSSSSAVILNELQDSDLSQVSPSFRPSSPRKFGTLRKSRKPPQEESSFDKFMKCSKKPFQVGTPPLDFDKESLINTIPDLHNAFSQNPHLQGIYQSNRYPKILFIFNGDGTVTLVNKKNSKKGGSKEFFAGIVFPTGEARAILFGKDHQDEVRNALMLQDIPGTNRHFAYQKTQTGEEILQSPLYEGDLTSKRITANRIYAIEGQLEDSLRIFFKEKKVHKDLKIENIFFYRGKFIIADFDAAFKTDENTNNSYHASPVYNSPEHHRKPKENLYASDALGYGMILLSIAANQNSLPEKERLQWTKEIVNMKQNEVDAYINELNISTQLKGKLKNLLDPNPEKRHLYYTALMQRKLNESPPDLRL